jgi:putative hydrolase of HD superfamily
MAAKDPWGEDLLQLKRTPRSGWQRIGVEHPESVAEHSFAVGLLAWREARSRGLDAGKVLLMGLLHDFHEARLGDIPSPVKRLLPGEALASCEDALRREQWEDWAPELLTLLEEFEAGESEEARLVQAQDRAELRLQARRYLEQGYARAAEFLEGEDG